jgi:dTDP-4-dehydrorhamnose reductase
MFRLQPWAVINAVGDARVDAAENDPHRCFRLNTTSAELVASAANRFRVRLLSFSTDFVFDGQTSQPYTELDIAAPCNVYGHSKLLAEKYILDTCPTALIVRTSPLFAAGDPHNFLSRALREISGGREVATVDDLVVSPTYVPHLVDHALDLLIDGEHGIWHLANRAAVSWSAFARLGAQLAGLDETLVAGTHSSCLGLSAPRPPFAALGSIRGTLMPTLEEALVEYLGAGSSWRERRREVRHV